MHLNHLTDKAAEKATHILGIVKKSYNTGDKMKICTT